MKTRWARGIVATMITCAMLTPSLAEAGSRRTSRTHPRRTTGKTHHSRASGRARPRRSSSNIHHDIAAAHAVGALIGLAILGAVLEDTAPPPHTCRYITRKEWVPGRYQPYTQKRWVPTRHGGYYEDFTAYRWVEGYYRTVTVKAPNCCP